MITAGGSGKDKAGGVDGRRARRGLVGRKYYKMGPDFSLGGAPGFKLENEEALVRKPILIGNILSKGVLEPPPPWPQDRRRRGFPEWPEKPCFLFDRKLGRPPRDLEIYHSYWVISEQMKAMLESVDPEGFAYLQCDVVLRNREPGPRRWLCDATRVLDAIDVPRSKDITVRQEADGSTIYDVWTTVKLRFGDEIVGPAHSFRVVQLPDEVYCDDFMKAACKAAGVKGVSFRELAKF